MHPLKRDFKYYLSSYYFGERFMDRHDGLLETAIATAVASVIVSGVLMLQGVIPTTFAANSVAPNVVFTLNVPSVCEISLTQSINFGSLLPSANTGTTSQNVLDTNGGNGGAFIAVSGSNWIGTNALNVFGVSNTVWSDASTVSYGAATQLTFNAAPTGIAVDAGTSTHIWFGLAIPAGQAADAYSENIIVINTC